MATVRPAASAPFEIVLERVVDGLRHEYEDPIEQITWDEGYVGTVWNTSELLWELDITENDEVHRALQRTIQTYEWCERDPYAATPTEAVTWGWALRTTTRPRRQVRERKSLDMLHLPRLPPDMHPVRTASHRPRRARAPTDSVGESLHTCPGLLRVRRAPVTHHSPGCDPSLTGARLPSLGT
ncbi:HEPN-associated N-terminal domain-containing protein [Kribbella turkmenica]|uniref:HEPN-associated N-terminal domain-containing protein n=1 Tax=Kribbella turkmenica TaxID=2530375 RepID=UPI0038996690